MMSDAFYGLGRALLEQTVRLYYRRIEVIGRERLPERGAAILVANHPNSVADAFLVATQLTRRKVNFIAKDSVTRAPIVGWFARRFGLVGVARAMEYEGRRELARQRNQAAVEACVPRLLAGELLAIFGEGISTDARHLQVIRKGALRLGYAAERAAGFTLGLLWIPVGISYSAKQHFRSDVVIRVGEPFRLVELHPDPAGYEAEVLQLGTQRLQLALEALVVHIEREELGNLIDRLGELLETPADSPARSLQRLQRINGAVHYFNQTEPDRLAAIDRLLLRYERQLSEHGLTDEIIRQRHPALAFWKGMRGVVGNLLLMLLNLYGWANSFIPRWTAALGREAGRRNKDLTRLSTYAAYGGWAGAAVAFPLQTWLVYAWAAGRSETAALVVAPLYALTLLPSWALFVRRRDVLRERYATLRDAMLFLLHARPAMRLQVERRRLQRALRVLLRAYDQAGPRAA